MRHGLWMVLLTGCWPYLSAPYEDYVDGDSDTADVDTEIDVDTEPDTDPDTDPDTEADTEADTEPDTEADTEPDTEADTEPDTTPDGAIETTIEDVRRGDFAEGTRVQIRGARVSSPQGEFGFYVQASSNGLYTGIYIYTGAMAAPDVELGDRVDVAGDYLEFSPSSVSDPGTLSEIAPSVPSDIVVTGSRPTEFVAQLSHANIASFGDDFESQVVRLSNSVVTSLPNSFGEFTVTPVGGGDSVIVDDTFYDINPLVGDTFSTLTGILTFNYGAFKLLPRSASDVVADQSGDCPAILCADDLEFGDVLVSELMFNPGVALGDDGENEWIEVYNASGVSVNLDGAILSDLSTSAVIRSDAVIPAGDYAVFRHGAGASWGWGLYGLQEDGAYGSSLSLTNSTPESVALGNVDGTIDESALYSTGQSSRSWSRDMQCSLFPASFCWCYADSYFGGSGERATPGTANDSCQ